MSSHRLLPTGAVLILSLTACGATTSAPPTAANSPASSAPASIAPATSSAPASAKPASSTDVASAFKVAVIGPQSGDLAFFGKPALNAAQLAVDQWNEKGGASGVKAELVQGDDQGKPDVTANLAKKYADDPTIIGIDGPMNTASCLSAGPIFEQAKLPWVTESCTDPKVTAQGWKMVRADVANNNTQGPADADFIVDELHAKKVAVVDSKTAFSTGLADLADKRLKERGVQIQRDGITAGEKDYSAIVTKVKAYNPDVFLFLNEGAEYSLIAQEMRKQGVKFPLMGTNGAFSKGTFIDKSQGAAEGAYVSFPGPDSKTTATARDYLAAYRARYHEDPAGFDAGAYDAMGIILNGVSNAVKTKGSAAITRADVDQAIGQLKDYKGALGTLNFDSSGAWINAPIFIYQVKNGDFTQIKAIESKSGR